MRNVCLGVISATLFALLPALPAMAQFNSNFASSLSYIYTLRIEIKDPIFGFTLYETELLNEDPQTADLDLNGIVDYGHAQLLDAMAARPNNPYYPQLVRAWNHNWAAVQRMIDQIDVTIIDLYLFEIDYFDFVNRDKIARAATGLVTLGEPAGLAALQLLEKEFGVPVDPRAFDLSMGPYLGVAGDADADQICNRSEYIIFPANYPGFGSFVSSAIDPNQRLGGGACSGDVDYNAAEEPAAPCAIFPQSSAFDAEGTQLYASLGLDWATADYDQNAMIDSWEVALASLVLCDPAYPQSLAARTRYTGNLWRLNNDRAARPPYRPTLAALGTTGSGLGELAKQSYGMRNSLLPATIDAVPPLAGRGNIDDDAFSNQNEYDRIFENGGTREQYLTVATFPLSSTVDRCVNQCGGECASTPGLCTDFEAQMRAVDTALDPFREELGGYTFDPASADINGGGSIENEEIFPNGLLDADEFALIRYFQANPSLDFSATGGANAQAIAQGYQQNLNQMGIDLGGNSGLIEIIAPSLKFVLAAYFLLGDENSVLIPVTAMTEAAKVDELDLGVRAPNPANYVLLPQWLAFTGDADGDGYTNAEEYACFRPRSQCCYLRAATDPNIVPDEATCSGGEEAVELEPNDGREPGACPVDLRVDAEGQLLYGALGWNWFQDDMDGNGVIDRWEALLLADTACSALYDSVARARNKFTGNYSRVLHDAKLPQNWEWRFALTALATANADLGALLGNELGLTQPLQELTVEQEAVLRPDGDLDGDGRSNGEELEWVRQLGLDYYRAVVIDPLLYPNTPASNSGEFPETCPAMPVFDAQGTALYAAVGWDWADFDSTLSGIPDSWEVALLADVLCNPASPFYQQAREAFTDNLLRLQSDPEAAIRSDYLEVLAALMTVSPELVQVWRAPLRLLVWPARIQNTYLFGVNGDLDDDGLKNVDEFSAVAAAGGSRGDYVFAAQNAADEPCLPQPCAAPCTGPGLVVNFESELVALLASLALIEPDFAIPADEADLDENGIRDVAHARLLDSILTNPLAPNHCCVRSAWEFNATVAADLLDEFEAYPLWPFLGVLLGVDSLTLRTRLEVAITGLMTLGEPETQAILADALNGVEITPPLPRIDLSAFDASAVVYLGRFGDADTDGICNFGEYGARVSGAQGFDDFVAAALNPSVKDDAGACPPCDGDGDGEGEVDGEIEGEGEGSNTTEGEGDPDGGAEGEGQAEGELLVCLPSDRHAADYAAPFGQLNSQEWERVLALFASGSFGYCPGTGTPDAYCTNGFSQGNQCRHTADFGGTPWQLSVNELTRVAQLFTASAFTYAPRFKSEDGFVLSGLLPELPGPVSVSHLPLSTGTYVPGEIVELFVSITMSDASPVLGLELEPPAGWQLAGWSGQALPQTALQAEGSGVCAFIWLNPPSNSLGLRVQLRAAANASGTQPVASRAFVRRTGRAAISPWYTTNYCVAGETCPDGGAGSVEGETTEGEGGTFEEGEGSPEGDPCAASPLHTADRNGDNRFNLSELLRLVQFFNSGSFGCSDTSTDGYAPQSNLRGCCEHDSDYRGGANWRIELPELLRGIQFFNAGGYYLCNDIGSPDGFCAGQ